MDRVGKKNYCYNKMMWLVPNNFYAEQLFKLYSNPFGEMVSALQITYQSYCLMPFGDELGKALDLIASEDFFHAKTLAEMIVMLGGTPVFFNDKVNALNQKNYCLSKDKKTLLNQNIILKENSIINYKTCNLKIDNKFIKNALNQIILEEECHLQTLKDFLKLLN